MENKRKKYHKISNHTFLQLNPEYHLIYLGLLKEAKTWRGSGQYWLGDDCIKRANCLTRGDINGSKITKHSEDLFHPTKKFKY